MTEKLSERVERLEGPSFTIEQEIGRLINPQATRLSVFPAYTASLDAAMSLVPEGWAHGYRWNARHKTARGWCEFIPEPPFAPEELLTVESRKCATPAIALCAAALKARGL